MRPIDTKERFSAEFEIVKMNRNSITLLNRNGEMAFIHRNAFNTLMQGYAEDYRVVEREFNSNEFTSKSTWVEVLCWKCI
jgi:hypothetical protein